MQSEFFDMGGRFLSQISGVVMIMIMIKVIMMMRGRRRAKDDPEKCVYLDTCFLNTCFVFSGQFTKLNSS